MNTHAGARVDVSFAATDQQQPVAWPEVLFPGLGYGCICLEQISKELPARPAHGDATGGPHRCARDAAMLKGDIAGVGSWEFEEA